MSTRIHVAVGVIYSSDKKQVLISKRKANQHLAGFWEFPGGKVEKDEDIQSALRRELHEELAIDIKSSSQLTTVSYDYQDKKVFLDIWQVDEWNGKPESKEGQEFTWVDIDKLNQYKFPEANLHIVNTLSLSSIYLVSPKTYNKIDEFMTTVEQCFKAGIKLFQLRLESRKEPEYPQLISKLILLTEKHCVKFIINQDLSIINKYKVDGVHLKSEQLFEFDKRPIDEEFILGASCHNERELVQAKKLKVNYAFLSPVKKTQSHPESTPLGWENFKSLSSKVNFPLFALGGMRPDDLHIAKANNAHGIAMISAVWDTSSQFRGKIT